LEVEALHEPENRPIRNQWLRESERRWQWRM